MSNQPIEDNIPPAELAERFGPDADLYAGVRAQAAAAAGRTRAACKWEAKAEELEGRGQAGE